MSKLEQLINELCSDGVEYAKLAKVCYIASGKDHKKLEDGKFPVYGSGGIMRYVDSFLYNKPSVLIPRKGSISNLFYVEQPFWVVDTIFYTEIDEIQIVPKFLYYVLSKMHLEELNSAGGVPSLTKSVLDCVSIPLPPLPVQEEIVRILDKFTSLEAELEAELEARKKQFSFYRAELIELEDIECKPLGEVCRNLDYLRRPVTKSTRSIGEYPYYGASGIVDYVDDYIFNGDYLLVSEDGANLVARTTPIAFSASGKIWVNNHAHILEFENKVTQRFVEFLFSSMDISNYINTAAQPKLTQASLNNIRIPFPPFEVQARIVSILDRFDALVNDITQGLPAELAARRRQYEYYRDKLLTFKEKAS